MLSGGVVYWVQAGGGFGSLFVSLAIGVLAIK